MSSLRSLLVAGVTLFATATTAVSADLNSGGGSMKDSGYFPVARGCPSWYARFDTGYTSYDRPSASEIIVDDYANTQLDGAWSIGGGIGRYLTCAIRADLTVDHRFNSDLRGTNDNPNSPVFGRHKFGYESTAILANFYYDFNAGSRFTPYIGVGLGVAHNQTKAGRAVVAPGVAVVAGVAGQQIAIEGADTWQAAGAIMTGFTVALRSQLKLDAGYRFLYLGEAKTGQIRNLSGGLGGPTTIDSLHAHEFRVGLRYDIR